MTGIVQTPLRVARKNEFLNIQVLRLFAAVAVVVTHGSFYAFERLDPTFPYYHEGADGVRLFFVISGFVMMWSSSRLTSEAKGWLTFISKRAIRVVPLYWFVTTFKVAVLSILPSAALHATLDWNGIAKSYLFIPSLNSDGEFRPVVGVGWTLNFEMFFYALFAIALLLRVRPLAFMAPMLVALSLLSLMRGPSWPEAIRFWADPIVLDFLAGMLLVRYTKPLQSLPVALGYIISAIGLIFLFVPGVPHPSQALPLVETISTTLMATAVVAGAVILEGRLGMEVPRILVFGGTISYSLYLIHSQVGPLVPQVMSKLGLHFPVFSTLGTLPVSLIAAVALYRLVETPFSRAGDRAARRTGLISKSPRLSEA